MQAKLSQSRRQLIAERARLMRHAQTDSEFAFWQAIRSKRLGVAFKRQFPIGNHIADFVACRLKLAIEIDGGYHVNRAAADARKDRHLTARVTACCVSQLSWLCGISTNKGSG